MTREQFLKRKAAIAEAKKNKESNQPKALSHAGCKIDHSEFLQALAEREELVRNGRMTTIIFIRDNKNCKNEISGYIDLAHRLKTEDFRLYFEGKKISSEKGTRSVWALVSQGWGDLGNNGSRNWFEFTGNVPGLRDAGQV